MENPNLPALRPDNVQLISKSAPEVYDSNSASCRKCSDFGQQLLDEIARTGMTDDLDVRCAAYIDKAKRTLKAMNERRTPFTKIFDQIRSGFTAMENAVDVAKKDSVPFRVQQARNAFAARKREEAERLRQQELQRLHREQSLAKFRIDVEEACRAAFDAKVTDDIAALDSLAKSLTLDNFNEVADRIGSFPVSLPNEWFKQLPHADTPADVTPDEADAIRRETLNSLARPLKEQYQAEIADHRDALRDTLPARRAELEKLAQASAEEKARLQEQIRQREAAQAERLAKERLAKEQQQTAAAQAKQQASEMQSLFDAAQVPAPSGYQPKTSVKRRIECSAPEGFLAVFSIWWSKEGQFLPLDELAKMFKKQITYCEKLANDKDNPETIQSQFVLYVDEIKAK